MNTQKIKRSALVYKSKYISKTGNISYMKLFLEKTY